MLCFVLAVTSCWKHVVFLNDSLKHNFLSSPCFLQSTKHLLHLSCRIHCYLLTCLFCLYLLIINKWYQMICCFISLWNTRHLANLISAKCQQCRMTVIGQLPTVQFKIYCAIIEVESKLSNDWLIIESLQKNLLFIIRINTSLQIS